MDIDKEVRAMLARMQEAGDETLAIILESAGAGEPDWDRLRERHLYGLAYSVALIEKLDELRFARDLDIKELPGGVGHCVVLTTENRETVAEWVGGKRVGNSILVQRSRSDHAEYLAALRGVILVKPTVGRVRTYSPETFEMVYGFPVERL